MRLHISKELIDGLNGLTIDASGKALPATSGSKDDWAVGCQAAQLRVEDLAAVSGRKINILPDKRFVRAIAEVAEPKFFPLKWSMPPCAFKDYLKRLQDDSWDVLGSGSMEYYHEHFLATRFLLRSLERTRIDLPAYTRAMSIEKTPGQRSVLQSFRPDNTGYAAQVIYNQHGSRTGRLTERAGPQILRLRKDLRHIIGSRFERGAICQVDFVSLEARIAAAIAGMSPERDVYSQIARDVFDMQYSRDQVKLACLSVIYGAGAKRLAGQLKVSRLEANALAFKISSTFGVPGASSRLLREAVDTGMISNYFGRLLRADDKASHVLYNNLIQSTGVDVAMAGFRWILNDLGNDPGIVPIFVLHDAIILDVDPGSVGNLKRASAAEIPIAGFDAPFYADVSVF